MVSMPWSRHRPKSYGLGDPVSVLLEAVESTIGLDVTMEAT
jgi:hypothetical protein